MNWKHGATELRAVIGQMASPSHWRNRLAALRAWARREGRWLCMSLLGHTIALLPLLFLMMPTPDRNDSQSFELGNVDNALTDAELEKFELGKPPIDPTVLNTETLTLLKPPSLPDAAAALPDPKATEVGGGGTVGSATGGFGALDLTATGPGPLSRGQGIAGGGTGDNIGAGGAGTGFGGRGQGMRKAMLGGFGGTKDTERAVAGGIQWLVKHQNGDGSWSLDRVEIKGRRKAQPKQSGGEGFLRNDTAGTAMALLPFLAANETHRRGGFKKTVGNGLAWLVRTQGEDGCFSPGPIQQPTMYAHALATIAICEAFGLTKDRGLRNAAQRAVRYIEKFQHPRNGGWRYVPQDAEGDISVFGWCVMALKSAQMAGLEIRPQSLELARKWLDVNARGKSGGLFGYLGVVGDKQAKGDEEPEAKGKRRRPPMAQWEYEPSPTRSAIGILCLQYLGEKPASANIQEGIANMMANLPTPEGTNFYYWYYATQVVHNVPGTDWDRWNRQMRRVLIETQVATGDNTGSWDPDADPFGSRGGRLMCTAFGTLILEVYYRYLPLYRVSPDRAEAPGR